jgi:uncharacterized protein YhaN
MRLARLDLTRYGKFTDYRIDFGPRQPGRSDLHIVYGPNEAGKSTALSAFLDLLFGIETQSRYGFLHPYSTMRIGAALELDGGVREFVRIKRPQNSLLDDKGQAVAEGILLRDLGGIDRDPYRTMFSLDDETLEAGGKSILASKGDLGQLLFSASAGLADLSQTLVDLQGEADGFYKYRARSGELPDLKSRLGVLKERKDDIDTLASTYAQLIESRDRAAIRYEEAIGESRRIRSRMEGIQRHLNALPRLAALRGIRGELEPLADLPEAPDTWATDLPGLQKEDTELSTREQGVGEDIKRLSDEIAGIVLDDDALGIAERVDRLADSRARHVTADKDLPERRLQKKEADFEISSILRRLEREGEADPKSLILGASAIGGLRELMERRSGVEAALQTAQTELSGADHRLAETLAELEAAGGDPNGEQEGNPAAIALTAAVAAARGADHAARRRMAEKSRTSLLEALAERMAALAPWRGDIEALARMSAPEPTDLETWKAALAETQKQIDRQSAETERLTGERRRLHAEMEAIGAGLGLVDDGQAATIRTAREEAWATHRRQLDRATADAFENLLRRDDLAVNARLSHSKDAAKLQQIRQSLAVAEADLAGAETLLAARTAEATRLRARVAASVATMTLAMPADLSLAHLQTWLDRRQKALEAWTSLRQVEGDLRDAEADGRAACDKIRGALALAGAVHDPNAGYDTLLAAAQSAIDREANLRALRAQAKDRQREVKRRQKEFDAATKADRAWSAAWDAAHSKCWLGETGADRSIATVREILSEIAGLAPAIEKRASLADRIRKMEDDQQAFTQEVKAIAKALGGEPDADDIQGVADAIGNRIRQARADQTTRVMKIREVEALQRRQREIAAAVAVNQQRKAEMTGLFGVASLNEVGGKLRKIEEKASLRKRQIETERDILDAVGLASLPEAEATLDGADRASLESELAELMARFDDQDQRTRDLFAARSKAADQVEAVGGDDAAARIEQERRTTLLEIEEKALRYFRLRAGIVAAEQALRAYRDKHRSAMMIRASEAFRIISRGAYARLATQPGKDGEVLIGVGSNGRSKLAAEMSKGARFQLYLALRVAGYEEFARARRSVPFIADDIMETFDDFRAEEAFRLFSEMGQVGQVIYLTHHRHLCDIARRTCPDIKVHELPADNSGGAGQPEPTPAEH